MNDRQRLEAIIGVVCKYLPPDGIPANEAMSQIIALVDPLPEPVQEPVAWMDPHGGFLSATYIEKFASGLDKETHSIPLYTTPPAAQPAVPLTDEQIQQYADSRAFYGLSNTEYREGIEKGAKWAREQLTAAPTQGEPK